METLKPDCGCGGMEDFKRKENGSSSDFPQ